MCLRANFGHVNLTHEHTHARAQECSESTTSRASSELIIPSLLIHWSQSLAIEIMSLIHSPAVWLFDN